MKSELTLRRLIFGVLSIVLSHLAYAQISVSVLDYGAVGDGITNDRAAIQNAMDDVNLRGGGTVTLPYRSSCTNLNGVCNTFLSGNLTLMSHVTLAISSSVILQQSQNSGDYTYTPLIGHNTSSGIKWDTATFANLPFLYGPPQTSDIEVSSGGPEQGGTIQMTTASGGNESTLQLSPIGLYGVTHYTISNISILGSHQFNLELFNTSWGTVSGVTINTAHSGELNDDGISIQNSQHINITGNIITTDDDGVYVWASYNDPRGNTAGGFSTRWWSSATPQPSTNIVIDANHITSGGGMLIPWGAGAPDPSQVEMSDIQVQNNTISNNSYSPYAVHCWCDSPFYGEPFRGLDGGIPEEMDASPVRDVTFTGNTYTGTLNFPWDFGTSIVTDFPSPQRGGESSETVMNGGFEVGGAAYWSSYGARGSDVGAWNESVDQDGQWYGYIQTFSQGYTALYQGVRVVGGRSYTLAARLQSSGQTFRLIVYDTCARTLVASQSFSNTSWQTISLPFVPAASCGTFNIGIDNGAGYSSTDWARIDDMTLSSTIDSQNPQVTYSHVGGDAWTRYTTSGDYDGDHKTSQNAGEYVLIPFIGSSATLLAYTYPGLGSADISLDGGSSTQFSWSTTSSSTQYPIYTTPPSLGFGLHTLKVVVHGDGYIDFDALQVTP